MRYYKFFILLLLTLSSCLLFGQVEDYDIRHFTSADGLSSDVVRSVVQDENGIMWFATDYGLNRFDGEKFKVFTKRKHDLVSNLIYQIHLDKKGKIWMNFETLAYHESRFLSIFDPKLEKVSLFNEYFPHAPFQSSEIKTFNADQENNIWIVLKDGSLYRYNKKLELVLQDDRLLNSREINFFEKNELWISSGKKLVVIDMIKKSISQVIPFPNEIIFFNKITDNKIGVRCRHFNLGKNFIYLEFDYKNNKYLSEDKYSEFVKNANAFRSFQINNKNQETQYWLANIRNLYVTDNQGILTIDFSDEIVKPFHQLKINDMLLDDFDNIWAASGKGILLFSPKKKLFQNYLKTNNPKMGGVSFRGLAELNDQFLLAATYRGFYQIDKTTGDTTLLKVNNWTNRFAYGLGIIDRGDHLLSGMNRQNSFWLIDKNTLSIDIRLLNQDFKKNLPSFYQDKFNQIWVKSDQGLCLLDLNEKEIKMPKGADQTNEVYQMASLFIFENEDELLVGTKKGLFSINHEGTILDGFEELSQFQITGIHRSSSKIYWLSTKGNGLIKWNRENNSFQQFSKEQGLSNDYIYSITEDEFGYFWLPSNNGLMRFNPIDYSINIFNKSDGIAHREFNTHSSLKGKDGRLYFGGLNGITAFYPKDFQFLEKRRIPLIVTTIKKLQQGEAQFKNVNSNSNNQKEIYFDKNDKAISIDFCLLDYPNSFKSQYAYKIEGFENEWKYLDDNRLIVSRLPYGEYLLKIKAQGKYGSWSEHILEFPLHVIKPFHLTWQFLLLVILGLIGVIDGIFRWRIKFLEKKNLALENIIKARTKELADLNKTKDQFFAIIAHDMRGLVLSFKNISQKVGFLQRKGRHEEVNSFLQSVDKSADSLSNLLDNLLNWALVEKGVFPHHPELFNLERLVLENIKLFTQVSRIKSVKLSYEVPETLNLFADKNAVSTIIRNLLNNAIKFSSAGDEVIIEATQKSEQIQILIKDTGVGIASGKLKNIFELDAEKNNQGTIGEKGTGLGLLLCKELVTLNQGEIRIESQEGKGTNVLIEFPLVA